MPGLVKPVLGSVIGKFWLDGPGLEGKAKRGARKGKDLSWTGRHNYCCTVNLDHKAAH